MNIINVALKVLQQDSSPLTPPEDKDIGHSKSSTTSDTANSKSVETPKKIKTSITLDKTKNSDSKDSKTHNSEFSKDSDVVGTKKENTSIIEDISFKDESLCEIDGTPTGRLSPIIQSKKLKNNLGKSTDFRDKKKLPNEWASPNSKSIKLTFPTPKGGKTRLRQSRIMLVKTKPSVTVDLTCSPEIGKVKNECHVQTLIKKESIENDDTILPSPTSGPSNFEFKESPAKWKKPLSLIKTEKLEPNQDENRDIKEMEKSINLLNRLPDRLKTNIKMETPTYYTEPMDQDATYCDTEVSVSLLDRVNKLEKEHLHGQNSPCKHPLQENINVVNTPPKQDPDSSVSLLRPNTKPAVENVKRKIQLVEPIYKEPTVRRKSEKRALQGWCCEQCKNFYGALYADDPVMLARKISSCSKHRGTHNPVRPSTPDGYWNPRWEVPTDTDDLNRMNDAL